MNIHHAVTAIGLTGLLLSCAMSKSGRQISDEEVAKIRDGQTTIEQVVSLFGAPDNETSLAGDRLFVSEYCEGLGLDLGALKEQTLSCDKLSITFDMRTRTVKARSMARMQ